MAQLLSADGLEQVAAFARRLQELEADSSVALYDSRLKVAVGVDNATVQLEALEGTWVLAVG